MDLETLSETPPWDWPEHADDEDIVEAAYEAMAMAEGPSGDELDEEDDDPFVR